MQFFVSTGNFTVCSLKSVFPIRARARSRTSLGNRRKSPSLHKRGHGWGNTLFQYKWNDPCPLGFCHNNLGILGLKLLAHME